MSEKLSLTFKDPLRDGPMLPEAKAPLAKHRQTAVELVSDKNEYVTFEEIEGVLQEAGFTFVKAWVPEADSKRMRVYGVYFERICIGWINAVLERKKYVLETAYPCDGVQANHKLREVMYRALRCASGDWSDMEYAIRNIRRAGFEIQTTENPLEFWICFGNTPLVACIFNAVEQAQKD